MNAARRVIATVAAVGIVCACLLPASMRDTDAAWSDAALAAGAFTAGTVTPVTTMTCAAGLLQPVRFTWTAPTSGLVRTGYRWVVTGAISGSGTLAVDATSVELTGGLLGIGFGTFSLFAVGPGGWESTARTGTLGFTTGLLSSCSA